METDQNQRGEGSASPRTSQSEAVLDIIRTETVLSKLPVHNLAKKGRVNIQIVKTRPDGQVELKWEVSYSDRYGQARQLAYKVDTIIVDRAIELAGRPLPARICLGSLRDICRDLGHPEGGRDLKSLKKAFLQNAFASIVAKFKYKANDGSERTLEAGFQRYSVIFTGEQFSDGKKADAVYIEFQPSYREVLNNAPVRPLDLTYKKQLPPAAQRFYEIVSYKIFSALKYNQPTAKLPYSEYCTFSAQQRYFDYDHFKKQMYKVHRPHIQSGYIMSKVQHEESIDEQGNRDWIMRYVPGPKARAEFAAAHRGRRNTTIDTQLVETGEAKSRQSYAPRQRRLKLKLPQETIQVTMPNVTPQPMQALPAPAADVDSKILSALMARGITETTARELLANLKPNQIVLDQLEWGEHQVALNPAKFTNPAGFFIHLIRENVTIPATFETSRQQAARREEEQRRLLRQREREELERRYESYKDAEVECYLRDHLDAAEFTVLKEAHAAALRTKHRNLTSAWIEKFAERETRAEIGDRATILSFEEFAVAEKALTSANLLNEQPGGHLLLSQRPPPEPSVFGESGEPEHRESVPPLQSGSS